MTYKRILIFGAGAVGGYFGARLALFGADVTFIARGEKLKAIKDKGITLKPSAKNALQESVNAVVAGEPSGLYDLIAISVKASDTKTAAIAVKNSLAPGGAVMSLQNGVDNHAILAEYFPKDAVICGVIRSGISTPRPGLVIYVPHPMMRIGAAFVEGKRHEEPIYKLFSSSGVKCAVSSDIHAEMWSKFVWNAAFNSVSALTFAACGDMVHSSNLKGVLESLALEAASAAEYHGVKLPPDIAHKVLDLNPAYSDYKTSALQDTERNREPETDCLLKPTVELSRMGKISAPVSETVYSLLKFRYERWYHSFPRLAADTLVLKREGGILKALLIERKNKPFGWAIPGGMVDNGERVERAAVRELMEETGICLSEREITLLGVYSNPDRDERGHTVSVVYCALAPQDRVCEPKAADDAKNAGWFDVDNLPDMAFDHKEVVADAAGRYKELF